MFHRADLAALAAASLLLASSAGARSPRPAAPTAPESERAESRLLVTLPSVHPTAWRAVARQLEADYGLDLVASWPMQALGEQCIVFSGPSGVARDRLVARLAHDPRVAMAEPLQRFRTRASLPAAPSSAASPEWNDRYADLQHGLAEVELGASHRVATGKGVRIAVVDTGVDLAHPDLAGRVIEARDFVAPEASDFRDDLHGTAVAGVIAARENNRLGIVGIAPDAELLALRACWQARAGAREATCDSYTLAQALDYAVTAKPRLLNLSLGGPEDPLLARLVRAALARGIAVVAAADGAGDEPFPSGIPGVLAIAAADPSGRETGSARAALAAPGVDVLTTQPGGAYDFFSGSSIAAAHATAVAALVLERRPDLSPAALVELLVRTARGVKEETAAGADDPPRRLSACAALGAAAGLDLCGVTDK
ncbi:MAG: S8 family serine peptidase [Thermoanaerobaculia bacterium]